MLAGWALVKRANSAGSVPRIEMAKKETWVEEKPFSWLYQRDPNVKRDRSADLLHVSAIALQFLNMQRGLILVNLPKVERGLMS